MEKLLLSACIIVFAAGCSEEGGSGIESDLVNRWYIVSVTGENGEVTPYVHMSCAKDYIDFSSSGIYRSRTILECNGSEVADFDNEAGVYTKASKLVTISIDGRSREVTIERLKPDELKLAMELDGEDVVVDYTTVP